jgi:DnaJ-class molecular chaperone
MEETCSTLKCETCGGEGEVDCPKCKGTGLLPSKCDECKGTGRLPAPSGSGSVECDVCNGRGVVESKCDECFGGGKLVCEACGGTGSTEGDSAPMIDDVPSETSK